MNSKERIIFDLAMVTIFIATVWTSIELQWGVGIWVGGILSAALLLLYDLTSNWPDN
jgi:hypothetical protein